MVLIYLTAANATKISCHGVVVGIDVMSNCTTIKEVCVLEDETKPSAKLKVLDKILLSLPTTNEKVTVFVDDERLAEEYNHALKEEWDVLRYPQLWRKVMEATKRYHWPIAMKDKSRLSGFLYRELCETIENDKTKIKEFF